MWESFLQSLCNNIIWIIILRMVTQESYMNSVIFVTVFLGNPRKQACLSICMTSLVLIGVQCYSFIFSRNMPRSSILYLPNHTATLCLLASIYIMHHVISCNFWNHFLCMCLVVLGFDIKYFLSLPPSSICSYANVKHRRFCFNSTSCLMDLQQSNIWFLSWSTIKQLLSSCDLRCHYYSILVLGDWILNWV
jgi:hypothetical protein